MDEQNLNILERIHASYDQLTAAERKVADFVLSQHNQVQFMSITQLADECSTAEATISRFCRNLHLKCFNAFKIELARTHVSNQKQQEHSPASTFDPFSFRRSKNCARCAQIMGQQQAQQRNLLCLFFVIYTGTLYTVTLKFQIAAGCFSSGGT